MNAVQKGKLKDAFTQFAAVYSQHRPIVQRALNASFIFYVLFSTYSSLSARPSSSTKSKKGKGKGKEDDKKPPRVAVRWYSLDVLNAF
jgi:ATP-binding cassette, subfamily D (ALD), peroxisomal long-chain fatty acid import protein